jgi:hypothetical protein
MPDQEIKEFNQYWIDSMQTVIGGIPNQNRPAGGPGFATGGHSGVDYNSHLIPWCKGNSVSVDQRTLAPYRQMFQILIGKARSRLTLIDANNTADPMFDSGLDFSDLESLYGKAQAKGTRRVAIGKFDDKWEKAEILFVTLLQGRHIKLYETKNTHATAIQKDILQKINLGVHEKTWHSEGSDKWMLHGICSFLAKNQTNGGHIRLNELFGWETYIRDRWGDPSGAIPGKLNRKFSGTPTMSIPLHFVLAETLARAMGSMQDKEWGKNQSKIRRKMADAALSHPTGNRINLNYFYQLFAEHSAAHMADSFFLRHMDDKTSARYTLIEIKGSSPKQWEVKFEPEFLRWRTNQRTRVRAVGGGATTPPKGSGGATTPPKGSGGGSP